MKNLKLFLTMLVISICSSVNLTGQVIPRISEFEIDPMTINATVDKIVGPLKFPLGKQRKLSKFAENETGFVIIPPTYYKHDGQSKGIIVMYTNNEAFRACELRCPNCDLHHKEHTMYASTIYGRLICPSCEAQVEALFATGSAQLTAYHMDRQGSPTKLTIYPIHEIERDGKTMLRISPNPNNR